MAITLHNIKPAKGSKKSRKRVGRGVGSTGTTAGRGQKGQKSRSGVSGLKRVGLKKLMLSMPKLRGFNSGAPAVAEINVDVLAAQFGTGETVSPKTLAKKGLIPASVKRVKILGNGDITVALTITGCAISKSAAEKILNAKGKIEA